jgi:hypothetical protein
MSNKNKKTVKVSVKLEPGEAFVVANIEYLNHIEQVYRTLALDAETPQDASKWIEVADLVAYWVAETAVPVTTGFEDEDDWI